MIPLKDNVPTRSFPVVTVGLIAANVLVYVWEVSRPGPEAHVDGWGYYPCAVEGPCLGPARAAPRGRRDGLQRRCSCTAASCTSAATCSSSGSSATTSRTRSAASASSSGTCSPGSRRRRLQTFVTLHFGTAADASIPNVGASGAIAGVLGAYFVLLPRASVLTAIFLGFFFIFREVPAILFLGIWIVLQALDGTISITTPAAGGGVAFFAHIGGFAFGVLTVQPRQEARPAAAGQSATAWR